MTTHQTITGQLYVLIHDDGRAVRAIDGDGDVFMLIYGQRNAVQEARRQNRMYGLRCKAVRLATLTEEKETEQ